MNIKRITSIILASVMLSSVVACSSNSGERGAVSVSASASVYADWLTDRLGDSADGITVGTADDADSYGVDLDGLRDDGYVIRKNSGDTVIFGKTEDGLDRGVRYYANNFADVDTVNYTYGEGYRVKHLTIAGNDISEYSIYLDADSDECHRYAASELQKYIGDACGIYPEIVNEKCERMIALEPVTEEDERYATLGVEGFTISVENGNLYITGGTLRGCLYGVYEFLESYVGWRFLYDYKSFSGDLREDSHAVDYLYEAEHIDIPEGVSDTQTPSFELRDNYCGSLTANTPDYAVKLKGMNDGTYGKAKYNCYGVAKMAIHGISRHGFYQSYFGVSGDPFGLDQPCFTDEDFIDASIEYFVNRTQSLIDAGQVVADVDVSQIDSANFCPCANCMELVALDGGYVGPVLYYTNLMADAIDEAFPDMGLYIDMLAYWGTSSVPKETLPRDNVSVSYCFYNDLTKNACYAHPVHGDDCVGTVRNTTVSNKIFAEEFEGWCEIASRVVIWYYPGMWEWSAMASPTFMHIREDFEYFASFENVYGLFICPGYGDDGQVDDMLTFYLLYRLFWDAEMTEAEFEGYMKEYMYIMYGDGYEYIFESFMGRTETAKSECWSVMAWTDPSERMNLGQVADGFEADIMLFEKAAILAGTAEQEARVRDLSRSMYFTGLVATHSEWYLEGDDASRARYTEIYNYFKELAISTEFNLNGPDVPMTEDMFNIEENLAVNFSFNRAPGGSETWWIYE